VKDAYVEHNKQHKGYIDQMMQEQMAQEQAMAETKSQPTGGGGGVPQTPGELPGLPGAAGGKAPGGGL